MAGFAHRLARIDEEVDRQILLFVEQPQQQAAEPLVGLPVDLPEVVAGRVAAMVGELEAAAALGREPVGAALADEGALGDHVQVLQLLQEVVFESERHEKSEPGLVS